MCYINVTETEYGDDDSCLHMCITRFVETFPQCIILIELGGVTRLDKEQQDNLVRVMSHDVQYVVSLSSGSARFRSPTDQKSFKGAVGSIVRPDSNAFFVPFDKEEAEVFMKLTGDYSLEQKDFYYSLSNYNPKLLSLCVGKTYADAKSNVLDEVTSCVDEVKLSLIAKEYSWVRDSLQSTMLMFHYAYNNEDILIERLEEYYSSWLSAENITYIVDINSTTFKLAVNYPTIYDILMKMLHNLDKNNFNKINCRILHGINFEADVCKNLRFLDVCFGNRNKEELSRSFTFSFAAPITEQKPLKELKEGIIYQLRPLHPVIDAVAYVHDKNVREKNKDDKKEAWLLLIQVSLSSYSSHKSKADDLLKTPTGCERSRDCSNWIQYYRDCITAKGTDINVMYVYISPEEYITEGKVSERLHALGVLSALNDFSFGLVESHSSTATFVSEAAKKSEL